MPLKPIETKPLLDQIQDAKNKALVIKALISFADAQVRTASATYQQLMNDINALEAKVPKGKRFLLDS